MAVIYVTKKTVMRWNYRVCGGQGGGWGSEKCCHRSNHESLLADNDAIVMPLQHECDVG